MSSRRGPRKSSVGARSPEPSSWVSARGMTASETMKTGAPGQAIRVLSLGWCDTYAGRSCMVDVGRFSRMCRRPDGQPIGGIAMRTGSRAPTVELWSGFEARALRLAKRMSVREFAKHIGVSERMISKWEAGGKHLHPRQANQAALDTSLANSGPEVQARFERLRGQPMAASPATDGRMEHGGQGRAVPGLVYLPSIGDTLDVIELLGKADMDRRILLKHAMFTVGAAIVPSRDWLVATIDEAAAPRRRVSSSQVDAIRQVFGVFQQLDVTRGGGHARQQLTAYFTSTVGPLLRLADASTESGRALYEAGAEQLYLIGWMAFDDGEHALAQRYLIQSLRLAQEARSPELGAHVLAGLSDQATLTGHPDQVGS